MITNKKLIGSNDFVKKSWNREAGEQPGMMMEVIEMDDSRLTAGQVDKTPLTRTPIGKTRLNFEIFSVQRAPMLSRISLESIQNAMRYLPNAVAVLAVSPQAIESYKHALDCYNQSGFNPTERLLIQTAIAVENHSPAMIAQHSKALKEMEVNPHILKAVKARRAVPNARLDKLIQFTRIMVEKRGHASRKELESFLEAGYKQSHVAEIVLAIALETLPGYMANLTDVPLNDEIKSA